MRLLHCLMLFAVMCVLVRVPATAQASENWLDGDRLSWNFAGMAVPPAPVISAVPDSHCDSLIRSLEGVGDAEVANQGWRLYSAYEQAWDVSLISGLVSFDANCRPAYFQHFVFVDGVFAGTLAPDAMLPRLDGSLRDASVTGSKSISAVYDRYTPDDGLCCPSSETWVTFSIERTPAGPILVPQPAIEMSTEQSELDQAAQRAVYFSQLEANGDYDTLYTWMHADAQALVPQEAVVGWYENEWAPSGPGIISVTRVRFVDWTWGVTGKTYQHTAEVSFEQPFGDGSVVADVVRLVQDEYGEWRWFFGRDSAFIDAQIARYSTETLKNDTEFTSAASTYEYPPYSALQSPLMVGELGDVWELNLGHDSFWWRAEDFGWIDTPSPRYVAQPNGVWMVVSIDLGTQDTLLFYDFPYDDFVIEDQLGNLYYPNLTATDNYCDSYCEMDIVQQDFSGWVGHAFHQAVIFDVPAPTGGYSSDDPGFTLRTRDGLIAVPLQR